MQSFFGLRQVIKNIIAVSLLFCALYCASSSTALAAEDYSLQQRDGQSGSSESELQRPFRVGYMKFSPHADHEKTLGVADFAGWTAVSGLVVGSVDKQWVGAFSSKDGTPKWWLKAPADMTAPPAVFGSWVVLGFRDGSIYKVEVLTGKIVWKASLDSFPSRSYTLAGSTLLVVTAGQYLHSIDYQSGESQWLFDGGYPAGLSVRSKSAPVVYNNTVYYGISNGELLAVDLATGKLQWRFNPEYSDARFSDVVGEIVILNNRLIFSRNDGLVGAISLGSKLQRLVWSHRLPSVATSVFRGGRFFVGLVNGDLIAMQVSDGNRLWRTVTGQGISDVKAGERMLYVSSMKGRLLAVESANGNIKWTDELGGLVAAESFYIGPNIYFATGARNVYGYKLQ